MQIFRVSQILSGMTDAEALMLWSPGVKNWLIRKDPDVGKDWRQSEKEMTEDELVGWHHQLDGHELEQAPGVGNRQGSLACCSPWVTKSQTLIELNWTKKCCLNHFLGGNSQFRMIRRNAYYKNFSLFILRVNDPLLFIYKVDVWRILTEESPGIYSKNFHPYQITTLINIQE